MRQIIFEFKNYSKYYSQYFLKSIAINHYSPSMNKVIPTSRCTINNQIKILKEKYPWIEIITNDWTWDIKIILEDKDRKWANVLFIPNNSSIPSIQWVINNILKTWGNN